MKQRAVMHSRTGSQGSSIPIPRNALLISDEERMDLKAYLKEKREVIDRALDRFLPGKDEYPESLHAAMRYSLFAGGKRLRPILSLSACHAVGGAVETVLPYACALEMIHTYSLIHDDLPAMDNDDLRRGMATSHRAFGEAIAILAGDALLTQAFCVMADPGTSSPDPLARLRLIHAVAAAAGSLGMVGGQAVDILSQGTPEIDLPTLEYIHTHKTGAMIRASVRVGALAGGAESAHLEDLADYGAKVGLAFQIADDLLDLLGDEKVLGKPVGSDLRQEKKTYPALFGIRASGERARELAEAAVASLHRFGRGADPLRQIALYIVERTG